MSYGTSSSAVTEPTTWYNSPTSLDYSAVKFIWAKTDYTLSGAQTVQRTIKSIIGYIGANGSGSGTVTQVTFNGVANLDDGTGNVTITVEPDDVGAIANPTIKNNGQVLTYDSTAGEWVAANPSTGNVNTVNNVGVTAGTTNIDLKGSDIPIDSTPSTDKAVVTNASGKLAASGVTATELGYLSGVTSGIQAQINSVSGDVSGKVSKAGDTMTGNLDISGSSNPHLYIINPDIDSSAATIPNAKYMILGMMDKNDKFVSYVQSSFSTAGRATLDMLSRRIVSGSNISNLLSLRVAADGTRSVSVTDAEPWRSALGLGTSGAFPITIAQGGTGAASWESAANNLKALKHYELNSGNAVTTSIKRKISFGGNLTGLLIVVGTSAARCGLYVFYGSTSTVIVEPIKAASACSITTGTGFFTITSTSGSLYPSMFFAGYSDRISESAAT